MKMTIVEKKILYTFGCPRHKATIKRLRLLFAITPDPAVKKMFCRLSQKLDKVDADKWYRYFFLTLRQEIDGY